MKKSIFIIICFLCGWFISCRKDKKTSTCPPQNHYYVTDFAKQFNFKKNSYWVLKNTVTNLKDTLRIYDSKGITTGNLIGISKECYSSGTEEGFSISSSHNLLPLGINYIDYSGSKLGIYSYYSKYAVSTIAIIPNNGDSALYNNNSYKSKLENLYASLIVNGHSYVNVYQMVYYPDLFGFNRILWCPSIGFVKFEYFNNLTNQIEYWELDSYNVQLF